VAEVIWTDNALRDIEEIAAYIERDSIIMPNSLFSEYSIAATH
jgi:plasmid stabilization system protein ParE